MNEKLLVSVAPELLKQVANIVRECAETVREIERSKVERHRITETTQVRLAAIASQREVMMEFIQQNFAERRETFNALFVRLDGALGQGDSQATAAILGTIVDIAKTSPFAALRDAAQAHEALLDKNRVWDF